MILYSMLLSSNILTPEEGLLLTPFLKNSIKQPAQKNLCVKLLPEVEDLDVQANFQRILKFQVSKRTSISYRLN